MKIRTETEREARQLALRYFDDTTVQIVEERNLDRRYAILIGLPFVDEQKTVFLGYGRDAGAIDGPLEWKQSPRWERGLWARAITYPEKRLATGFYEWDGCSVTPDIAFPDQAGQKSVWLGPLPSIPC